MSPVPSRIGPEQQHLLPISAATEVPRGVRRAGAGVQVRQDWLGQDGHLTSAASAATRPSHASENPARSAGRSSRETSSQLAARLTAAPIANSTSDSDRLATP